jgi:hypothetical protein
VDDPYGLSARELMCGFVWSSTSYARILDHGGDRKRHPALQLRRETASARGDILHRNPWGCDCWERDRGG